MKVLLLSAYPEALTGAFAATADEVAVTQDRLTGEPPDVDFIVSYGYRHILKEPLLSRFEGRIINMHISLLPWNRGADPNFWSWFDRTPKGVTLHRIDASIDTGDVLAQRAASFGEGETLRSSYARLQQIAAELFAASWPQIRVGALDAVPQTGFGSCHRLKDKAEWWARLPLGHDTPVSVIEDLGRAEAAAHGR